MRAIEVCEASEVAEVAEVAESNDINEASDILRPDKSLLKTSQSSRFFHSGVF